MLVRRQIVSLADEVNELQYEGSSGDDTGSSEGEKDNDTSAAGSPEF